MTLKTLSFGQILELTKQNLVLVHHVYSDSNNESSIKSIKYFEKGCSSMSAGSYSHDKNETFMCFQEFLRCIGE